MDERDLLISLFQHAFTGKLDPSANLKPQDLADAVITKLNLNRTLTERNVKTVNEAIESFTGFINAIDADMDTELEQLGEDEAMVKNFVRGQKTACEKLREEIENI